LVHRVGVSDENQQHAMDSPHFHDCHAPFMRFNLNQSKHNQPVHRDNWTETSSWPAVRSICMLGNWFRNGSAHCKEFEQAQEVRKVPGCVGMHGSRLAFPCISGRARLLEESFHVCTNHSWENNVSTTFASHHAMLSRCGWFLGICIASSVFVTDPWYCTCTSGFWLFFACPERHACLEYCIAACKASFLILEL